MTAETPTVAAIVRAAGDHVPALLAEVEQRLVDLAAGHGPLLGRHAGHTIAAGGKRLRPLLVILAAGPRAADRAALVATGDLLFSRAFAELTAAGSLEAVLALSRATSALAEGELLQRQDAWNPAVALERYLLRCELKTARLFEASCQLGALAAHAPAADVAALGAFGRDIGIAFQLLDDVIDVAGPAALTGKHRGTDLLDGTVTLPLILARVRDPALAAVDLCAIAGAEQAEALCDRIAATGALEDARARALEMVRAATAQLAGLALEDGQREALRLVASSVAERTA